MVIQERTINTWIAELLEDMRAKWTVRGETLRSLKGRQIPDIIITEQGRPPLIIETEFEPARGLAGDTRRKLSQKTRDGKVVRAVISVVIPKSFKKDDKASNVKAKLMRASFRYRAKISDDVAKASNDGVWFPKAGFLDGTLYDIVEMAQLLNMATLGLDKWVESIIFLINASASNIPESVHEDLSEILHQKKGEQTNKMAVAILMNAFIFQEILSDVKFESGAKIPTIEGVKTRSRHVSIPSTKGAWELILSKNYYPIFIMAINIIEQIGSAGASSILDNLAKCVQDMVTDMANTQDVTSSVFQRLIADQKILAVFYTKPEAAAMMAAIACPEKIDDVPNVTVGDFACGTGILLHAFYRRLCQVYERTGRDMAKHHHLMMEERIIGCDVLPSHVHLTASSLAGLYMDEPFEETNLYILKYGRQKDFGANMRKFNTISKQIAAQKDALERIKKMSLRPQAMRYKSKRAAAKLRIYKGQAKKHHPLNYVRCGSMELIDKTQSRLDAFDLMEDYSLEAAGGGGKIKVPSLNIPEKSLDIVTMNPPYSSSNNPEQKSEKVHNPAFAGFNTSPDAQKAMEQRMNEIGKHTMCAGGKMPVYFMEIADRMLKIGGTLAVVLPLTVAQGESWDQVRKLLIERYRDIFMISSSGKEAAFSAETSIREIIIIATKTDKSFSKNRVTSVVLKTVPGDPLIAHEIGKQIARMRGGGWR